MPRALILNLYYIVMRRIYICLSVLFICMTGVQFKVNAQNKQNPILNHIALYVFDLQKSTGFYRDVLQLEVIPEPFKDGRHTWFKLGEYSQLHLIQGAKEVIIHEKSSHLCFSVSSVQDFIAELDKYNINRINMKGDSKSPTVRPDGVLQIYFQDPDGYWLEVNDAKL